MTNKEVFNLYEGLCEIGSDPDIKLSATTAYYLAYDKKILEPVSEIIIETRHKILKKYGKVSSEDGGWVVPKECIEEFKTEWQEFMDIDTPLTLKGIVLKGLEGRITIDTMLKLLPIIEE